MAKDKGDLTVRELASMGGEARAEKLTPAERKAIAKKAAAERWAKEKAKKGRK